MKTGTVKSESLSLQLSMAKQQGEKAIQLKTQATSYIKRRVTQRAEPRIKRTEPRASENY